MELKELLLSDETILDDVMREYFKMNQTVNITYEEVDPIGYEPCRIYLNGVEVKHHLIQNKLGNWLTRSNKILVKSNGELYSRIPTLRGLDVELIDLSRVSIAEYQTFSHDFINYSNVGEVILPTFPKALVRVSGILERVKVDKPIDLSRAFKDVKLKEIRSIFYECELSELDFSEVDLSNVREFDSTFSMLTVDKLILPKNLSENTEPLRVDSMFASSRIKEIVNLEFFPFDKLVEANHMFTCFSGMDIVINSKFKKLNSAVFMFSKLEGVNVSLPITERLPENDNWFYECEGCKIFIPMLKVERVLDMKMYVDDSNEIICSRELAKKII